MSQTYIDENGLIDLYTLPAPQRLWMWNRCFDQDLGIQNPYTLDIAIDLDTFADVMRGAGFPGVFTALH